MKEEWHQLSKENPYWDFINWSRLQGSPAMLCHKSSGTTLHTTVISDGPYEVNGLRVPAAAAFKVKSLPLMPEHALNEIATAAISMQRGWEIFIKGHIPIGAELASDLEPGTCFHGKHRDLPKNVGEECVVFVSPRSGAKMVAFADPVGAVFASEVEVIKTYAPKNSKKK